MGNWDGEPRTRFRWDSPFCPVPGAFPSLNDSIAFQEKSYRQWPPAPCNTKTPVSKNDNKLVVALTGGCGSSKTRLSTLALWQIARTPIDGKENSWSVKDCPFACFCPFSNGREKGRKRRNSPLKFGGLLLRYEDSVTKKSGTKCGEIKNAGSGTSWSRDSVCVADRVGV
jgi:hypothetical protein